MGAEMDLCPLACWLFLSLTGHLSAGNNCCSTLTFSKGVTVTTSSPPTSQILHKPILAATTTTTPTPPTATRSSMQHFTLPHRLQWSVRRLATQTKEVASICENRAPQTSFPSPASPSPLVTWRDLHPPTGGGGKQWGVPALCVYVNRRRGARRRRISKAGELDHRQTLFLQCTRVTRRQAAGNYRKERGLA